VNPDRLAITSGLAQRMSEHHGSPFSVHATGDLGEAVSGAKYVVTQMRVGGIPARIEDEKLGKRYNIIGQETTGVGGFAKALRTIPRILEVAHAMEKAAPEAVLVNFTNPAGIITESVLKHSTVKCVGLCNIPIGIIMETVKHADCAWEDVQLDYVGLNHLAWVRHFSVRGGDVTGPVLDKLIEHAGEEWEDPAVCENMQEAMKSLHMFCNPYLQYFYATEATLARQARQEKTRGEQVIEIEKALFDKYAQPDLYEKPPELSKRGGAHYSTAAFHLIAGMEQDAQSRQVVCCRNNGAVPTFDDDVAVELTAVIGKDGAKAVPQAAPELAIRGLMQQVKSYESLTVDAAVHGDREKAFQAMLENPLMPDASGCRKLLAELLEINRPHLQGTFFN